MWINLALGLVEVPLEKLNNSKNVKKFPKNWLENFIYCQMHFCSRFFVISFYVLCFFPAAKTSWNFNFAFLCSAVMNGIKERMHLRRFLRCFFSVIYFPIAKSIKKETKKKTCVFSHARDERRWKIDLWINGAGRKRRKSGSITKWSTRKWKTSLKSISFHSSAAVSIFYSLGNWKATLKKSRNSWFMWTFDGKMWWWWLFFSEKRIFLLNPWQKRV